MEASIAISGTSWLPATSMREGRTTGWWTMIPGSMVRHSWTCFRDTCGINLHLNWAVTNRHHTSSCNRGTVCGNFTWWSHCGRGNIVGQVFDTQRTTSAPKDILNDWVNVLRGCAIRNLVFVLRECHYEHFWINSRSLCNGMESYWSPIHWPYVYNTRYAGSRSELTIIPTP